MSSKSFQFTSCEIWLRIGDASELRLLTEGGAKVATSVVRLPKSLPPDCPFHFLIWLYARSSLKTLDAVPKFQSSD